MSTWKLEMGINVDENESLHCKVWAPKAKTLSLSLIKDKKEIAEHHLTPLPNGFFELKLTSLESPDYLYKIDGKNSFPDPYSRFQPHGVHGPSRLIDPHSFSWADRDWKGIPQKEYIIYELHVGTFTPRGTFEAIIEKLPYLKDLGITALELMPVIEFPGTRNWGYDGVSLFAPHHSYGGPIGLKSLINACHQAGIAIIIDVVYNHLGPEGNYLGQFGHYFTDKYRTPWGQAINYDDSYSNPVRQYFVDNALYWLTEYHADGLRLDAIHAIYDFSAQHILQEIQLAFDHQANQLGRQAFIFAESDLNDVRLINPVSIGGYGIHSQWSDDFHHALHAYITKEQECYFMDFGDLSKLAKSLKEGFVYEGQKSPFRKRNFGSSSKHLPGEKFVICMQNHDQIGNAGLGKRLGEKVNDNYYKIASLLLFCAPNIPLLFMGQEWNADSPFYFFTSFEDQELAKNVRAGYQKEFQLEDQDAFDPQNEERFLHSKLPWQQLEEKPHQEIYEFYQKLIHLRKSYFFDCRKDLTEVSFKEEEQWLVLKRNSRLILIINFSDSSLPIPLEIPKDWQLALTTSPENQTVLTALAPQSARLYLKI